MLRLIGQVMRILRDCRLDAVRRHIVVTITGPLYQGWGDLKALEDLWHYISSAVSTVSGRYSELRTVVDGYIDTM